MNKLSKSMIFIIILLVALVVISSYSLMQINKMIRTYSLVGDNYELSVIKAKEVELDPIEPEEKDKLTIVPIGDLTNYKIEILDGKAYITILNQNGCKKLLNSIDNIILAEGEKTEIYDFHTEIVYAYIDYESMNKDIYFLMKDGTLEHVTLIELLTQDKPKSNGILPGVKNVVNVLPGKTNNGHVLIAITSDSGYVVLNTLVN